MSRRIALVTGAARSGKSLYAEKWAIGRGDRLLYLATAEAKDEEMARRISQHQNRRGKNWITVEEPLDVIRSLWLHNGKVDCAVIDCLTLWISNLLIQRGEDAVHKSVTGLADNLGSLEFSLILVTNEVGWGIVPDNSLARQFRDLTGWANQRLAEAADEVTLMVAGIPFPIKEGVEPCS